MAGSAACACFTSSWEVIVMASIGGGGWLAANGMELEIQNHVDIWVCQKIGANDTLIVSVVVENYTLDHMFTEHEFHGWRKIIDLADGRAEVARVLKSAASCVPTDYPGIHNRCSGRYFLRQDNHIGDRS
uniref:Uncharacterized protein n=1 Tax=Romanomermis culicivorax TaxID=13658 RepID=A0A915JXR9_ROMCU